MKFAVPFVFVLLFSITSVSFAGSKKNDPRSAQVQKLVDMPLRPTIADLDAVFDKDAPNPFSSQPPSHRIERLRYSEQIVRAIVAMELIFPGATWYSLGRDAALVNDILDAFYRSIGQNDRAKRLDASRPSFNKDDEQTLAFLKTNGFDPHTIDRFDVPPFIMVDVTSFNRHGDAQVMSQSAQLVQAAYQGAAKAGKNLKNLVHKINFISIGSLNAPPQVEVMKPGFSAKEFFKFQRSTLSENGFDKPLFIDLSGFTYTPEWHPIFGRFEETEDGRTIARPSKEHSSHDRLGILAEMYEVRRVMAEPDFLARVQEIAHSYGYEFPLQRVFKATKVSEEVRKKAIAAREERKRREIELIAERRRIQLKEKRDARNKKHGLGPFAADYIDALENRVAAGEAPHDAVKFILEDLKATNKQLTRNELGCVLTAMFGLVMVMENKKLLEVMTPAVQASAALQDALMNETFGTDLYGSREFSYRLETNPVELRIAAGLVKKEEPAPPTAWSGSSGTSGSPGHSVVRYFPQSGTDEKAKKELRNKVHRLSVEAIQYIDMIEDQRFNAEEMLRLILEEIDEKSVRLTVHEAACILITAFSHVPSSYNGNLIRVTAPFVRKSLLLQAALLDEAFDEDLYGGAGLRDRIANNAGDVARSAGLRRTLLWRQAAVPSLSSVIQPECRTTLTPPPADETK